MIKIAASQSSRPRLSAAKIIFSKPGLQKKMENGPLNPMDELLQFLESTGSL